MTRTKETANGSRGQRLLFALLLTASLILPSVVLRAMAAPTNQQPDVWQPLKFFVGSWEGTAKGQVGEGKVERQYQFVLKNKYLNATHKSTYPPQDKNPKGEVHEDWGMISYDRGRKQFVLRQFHVEGFVLQYVFDSTASDAKTLVFITESIENFLPGWRAKETYKLLNHHEFIEVFELAAPGKEFEVYTQNHFKRRSSVP